MFLINKEPNQPVLILIDFQHEVAFLRMTGAGEYISFLDIFFCEVGVIVYDLASGHPRSNSTEHIADRDAQSADAGFAAALARFDRNDFAVVHNCKTG